MARMTNAQKITREMEEEALEFFLTVLEKLPDPRRAQGMRYPLPTVVVTALMAMVCGADDAQAMEQWSEEKSNEIKAIPELLRLLDLRGTTVTIDAMGCQTSIAQTIVDGGGDYLLPVKENQPTLSDEIQVCFAEADDGRLRATDEQPRPQLERFQEVDKGHGRLEIRTVEICRDLDWITTSNRWTGLSFVARIVRERTVLTSHKTSTETAYYIGSDPTATAEAVADSIRRHWQIENQLHWVLDVAFREDEARHRAKNAAENMTLLRHFALNIIKNDRFRKLGVANSRKRAGWDRGYLLSLLSNVGGS